MIKPDDLTDDMIREIRMKTGGIFVAGKECCTLALGEELKSDARDDSDESYYSARMDQALARVYLCEHINARPVTP